MNESIELYIIASSADRYAVFHRELASLPHVHVMRSYTEALDASAGFDAFFESLMSAREWGSVPISSPLYQTCIIKMPDVQVAQGRPPYGIPGIPIASNDNLTAEEVTGLILRESLRAIAEFNATNSARLQKIGAVDLSLGLDELEPSQALNIFKSVLKQDFNLGSSHHALSAYTPKPNHNLYH